MRLKQFKPYFYLLSFLLVVILIQSCEKKGVDDEQSFGNLQIDVYGLPAGVRADVTISGPGSYSHKIAQGTKLDGLTPGEYTISASPVTDTAGTNYDYTITLPGNASKTLAKLSAPIKVMVVQGQTTVVTVTYHTVVLGKLQLTINGLPTGVLADVTVNGPNQGVWTVTGSATIDSLDPGSYSVYANDITAPDGRVFEPDYSAQSIDVTLGSVSEVTINYAEKYGRLQVNISGLPVDLEADLTVYNNDHTFAYDVVASQLVDSLLPGPYTIEAFEVTSSNGTAYAPDFELFSFEITKGKTFTLTVKYKEKYGKLQFNISGLPSGTFADVTILDGSHTALYQVTGTVLIDSLIAGDYTAEAKEVTASDGTAYIPDFHTTSFNIIGGETSTISLNYDEKYGKLQLNITGLPPGTDADVSLFDKNMTLIFQATSTILIDSLLAEDYSLRAEEVRAPDGTPYVPDYFNTSLNIVGGKTFTINIDYREKYGKMDVKIIGLPEGILAPVKVVSPDGNHTYYVEEDWLIDSLEAGTYKVYADTVFNGSDTLSPNFAQLNVSVAGGMTTSVTIRYSGSFRYDFYYQLKPPIGWATLTGNGTNDTDTAATQWHTTVYFPDSVAIQLDGCEPIGPVIPDSGHANSVSLTHFSGEVDASISISESVPAQSVNVNLTSSSISNSTTFDQAQGSVGAPVSNMDHPMIILQIDNPKEKTIDIIFEWSCAGEKTDGPAGQAQANWNFAGVYWPNLNLCRPYWDSQSLLLFSVSDLSPIGLSGSDTLTITDASRTIGIRPTVNSTAEFYDGPYGYGNDIAHEGSSATVEAYIGILVRPRE